MAERLINEEWMIKDKITAEEEKRFEENGTKLKWAFKELTEAQESGDRKAEKYAFNKIVSLCRLQFFIWMDTEDILMLEELAVAKAKENAERHGLSMAASFVLELTALAKARAMTEDEFFNSDKPEEDYFMNTLRNTFEDKAGDSDAIKTVGAFLQEPESLEGAIEEVKEAKLWPWDFKH